jgi:multidrug efflux pump subunit AcrA (membrane-fusion protein)
MTRTYAARFSIIEPPPFIGIGMTASLTLSRPDPVALAEVPLSAIFQQGTQPAVWVVDKMTGTVALHPVTISRWRDETALIESGVKDGEIVAPPACTSSSPARR